MVEEGGMDAKVTEEQLDRVRVRVAEGIDLSGTPTQEELQAFRFELTQLLSRG